MLTIEEKHKLMLYPEVRITARKKDEGARGSGTILYSDLVPGSKTEYETYILTNCHVVDMLIEVKDKFSTLLKRNVKMDVLGTPDVETFEYDFTSRVIGGTNYQAKIMCYDKDRDLALLKLKTRKQFENVAKMYPKDKAEDMKCFMPVVTVGCGLGQKPVMTFGFLSGFGYEIENYEFIMVSAASIFGNCLPADSPVLTTNGPIPIADVRVGDRVWVYGHINGMKKSTVEEVIEAGEKEIYEIKLRSRTICASDNHPFLMLKKVKNWKGETEVVLVWEQVKNLSPGDRVAVLAHLPEREKAKEMPANDFFPTPLYSDESRDLMRLTGCFLGDGYVRIREGQGGSLNLCLFDSDKQELYSQIINRLFQRHCSYDDKGMHCYSVDVARLFDRLGLNKTATEKELPRWIWGLTTDQKKALLQGMVDADGHININGAWAIELNNEKLIRQLHMLAITAGYHVSNVSVRDRSDEEHNLNKSGVPIVPTAPSASFQIYPDYSKDLYTMGGRLGDSRELTPTDEIRFEMIRSISLRGREQTYDLKIRGTHNFFAEGTLVHNSGGATFLQETGEFIGVPSRISVALIGFSADVITHLSYSIPVWEVYKFLEDQVFQFIYDKDMTSADCQEERDQRRKAAELDLLRQTLNGS